jgi:mRNA interferase RelE/StbE
MKYRVELKPKAIKDLNNIPKADGKRIVEKLKLLEDNLQGDVKKLTNYAPEYRMRVGDWRILFEIEKEKIIVYRIHHRKEAYNRR